MDDTLVVPIPTRAPGADGKRSDHAPLPASPRLPLEAAALRPGAALTVLASGQGGLKRGFKRRRTVVLMLDETFILETPPLRAGWAKVGVQAEVPITGNHARRVIHGALNVASGHVEFLITDHWTAATYQTFVRQVRRAWRGWHIVLFVDRGSPHTAKTSRALAAALSVEVRWLPTATPELNACEGLWRGAKGSGLANRVSQSIDAAADAACRYLLALTPRQRLQQAGVLSGHFWLAT